MHYYKRNIGDYAKKAGRLSLLQHGVYCQLIDACYDRESFPTLEEAIEWVWASTLEEEAAVQFVLRRFFTLEGGKYVQNEIREDIAAYHERSTINKRIANQKQRIVNESSTNRQRTDGVDERNHKPLTINQEPLTKNQEKDAAPETGAHGIAPPDPRKTLFDMGVSLLVAHGSSDGAARSFLAMHAKRDEGKLAEVIGYLAANEKVEPRAYIAAAMKPKLRTVVL